MDDFLPLSSVEVDCIAGLPIHGYIRIIISISTLKLNIMGPQNQIIGILIISINIALVHANRISYQMMSCLYSISGYVDQFSPHLMISPFT